MDDFNDLKQLWNSKNTLNIPSAEQLQKVIKEYQRKKKRNASLVTTSFILCGIVPVLLIILHKPVVWTTTFGVILMIAGFISGTILKLKTLKTITKSELKSNKDYLENLIKVSAQKKRKVNWHLNISVFLLAIGYGFFIYEKIKENQTALIFSYLGITLFVLSMYFIFRPYVNKISQKEIKKLTEIIKDLH